MTEPTLVRLAEIVASIVLSAFALAQALIANARAQRVERFTRQVARRVVAHERTCHPPSELDAPDTMEGGDGE